MYVWVQCSCKPSTRQIVLSVLQCFISIWMKKRYTFKGQSLENGLSCLFQAIGNSLHLQQKQQTTKAKVKETDPIWSQICPSLLQYYIDWTVFLQPQLCDTCFNPLCVCFYCVAYINMYIKHIPKNDALSIQVDRTLPNTLYPPFVPLPKGILPHSLYVFKFLI